MLLLFFFLAMIHVFILIVEKVHKLWSSSIHFLFIALSILILSWFLWKHVFFFFKLNRNGAGCVLFSLCLAIKKKWLEYTFNKFNSATFLCLFHQGRNRVLCCLFWGFCGNWWLFMMVCLADLSTTTIEPVYFSTFQWNSLTVIWIS